jgi:hypothetical protein
MPACTNQKYLALYKTFIPFSGGKGKATARFEIYVAI